MVPFYARDGNTSANHPAKWFNFMPKFEKPLLIVQPNGSISCKKALTGIQKLKFSLIKNIGSIR